MSPCSIYVTQSPSHHFLRPNDPLRSATSGQHLWTTFSLSDLELLHPCGLSLDLCLMGWFSFKSSGNVVYWPSSFFPSSDPPWASKEHFTQTPTYSTLKLWRFIYCVFCCNESFCSYVYKSKYRENDTTLPVYFHIFGEMRKGRNYSTVLTAVRAGTFHYTVRTLSHSLLSCHLSSFQICSSLFVSLSLLP